MRKIRSNFLAAIVQMLFFNLQTMPQQNDTVLQNKNLIQAYHPVFSLESFDQIVLSFPKILKSSDLLILLIPEDISNTTPISRYGAHIEKARILLTWISIYARRNYKMPQVRIIKIPNDKKYTENQINSAIQNALSITLDNRQVVTYEMAELLDDFPDHHKKVSEPEFQTFNTISKDPKIKTLIHSLENIEGKKRLLITGGAGFIGSHLVKRFLENGYQVIAIDNLSCCTLENIQEINDNENFCFIKHDVAQPFAIDGQLDGVLHLASLPSPEMYYRLPIETMRAGLHGTKNCLELAKSKNARFLFTSTSEVYGDPEIHPQTEDYPGNVCVTGPRAQYDQSKRGGETFVKLYFDNYAMDVRIARIFNTYGPNMKLNDGRVVTNFIGAALENKPLLLYGGGKQTRSFSYVDDTVDGIMKLFETNNITPTTPIEERVFNIGNPNEFTIAELAQMVEKLSKKFLQKASIIQEVEQIDHTDPKLRCPEISRAQEVLGFYPIIPLEEGLEKTFLYFLHKSNI